MTETLVPASSMGGNKAPQQPRQMQATMMFQDDNYTIMRNLENISQQDIYDMPIHLILLGMGMLDARNYMPQISRQSYEATLRTMKSEFDDMYMTQMKAAKEISKGMNKNGSKKSPS
jgi:hypothetical protein